MREMKDSGIKWIGVIPSAWRTARVKNVAETMQSGGTPDSSNDTFYVDIEGGIPWVAIADMSTTPYVKDTNKHISEEGRKSKNLIVFEPGTILYAMYASVGKVSELAVPATINQALLAIVLNSSIDGSFFKYALNAWEPYIISESNGTTQFNLNANKVANLCFPMPNRLEQESIVRYLDTKCAQVDTLIANVQAQIEKLKAYKQSLITEVVTKGLDPTVPMKDSGFEWIGEIPAHWGVTRIKNMFELWNERNDEADLTKVNLISLYTDLGVVQHSDLTATTGNRAVTAEGYKIVRKHDIVVNIILCWMGAVGMSQYDGVTSPAYDIYRPLKDTNSEYYHYLFRTNRFNGECYRYGRGIMMMRWRTYSTEFRAINIPCPPAEEQKKIVTHLNEKCNKIDQLIAIKQAKIEKLEQYKRSLIYEYVTGKKEVR
jgi:restriction modification system DNA specificity domain protein